MPLSCLDVDMLLFALCVGNSIIVLTYIIYSNVFSLYYLSLQKYSIILTGDSSLKLIGRKRRLELELKIYLCLRLPLERAVLLPLERIASALLLLVLLIIP